jgi:hypothetical protein
MITRILSVGVLTIGIACAQAPIRSCTPLVPLVPLLNATASSGAVGDTDIACSNSSPGGTILTMNVLFTMAVPVLNTGGWTLTQGANTYTGSLFTPQQVRFTGVQFDTDLPTLTYSFTGIQVNPSLEPAGFVYHEFIAFTGPTVPTLTAGDVVVAINDNAPEPSTWGMMAGALVVMCLYRSRRG